MDILHVDNHLLAVDKPAGMPSQPDESGDPSLVDVSRQYVKDAFNKPGEVYLALLHRLDRPVSGVVLLARTSKAAARMADLFRRREIEKTYLALVECRAAPGSGARLENYLGRQDGAARVFKRPAPEAKTAVLSYRTMAMLDGGARALLEVNLETGIKHQIRVQLAHAGLPVVGDFRYGPFLKPARPEKIMAGRAILLHACRVRFVHPVKREELVVRAPLPEHWPGAVRAAYAPDRIRADDDGGGTAGNGKGTPWRC